MRKKDLEELKKVLDSLDQIAFESPGFDRMAALWRSYSVVIRQALIGRHHEKD